MSYLDLYEEETPRRERLNLFGLVILLAISGVVFYKLAGLPHLPTSWPSRDLILLTLRSPDIPLEALVSILTPIAWLVWLWTVFSIVVEVAFAVVERVTRGAQWVRRSRAVVSPLTIPWVRHAVDGAIVAAFVVNAVSRTAVPASAAPEKPIVLMTGQPHDETPGPVPTREPEPKESAIRYMVQPGDTLWTIAERFYGDGDAFARLVDANNGRTVATGQRFTREGVIQPGWTLLVPLPATALDVVETQTYYVVEPGDTLWSISARLLGDPLQWPRIFELNRGVARHPYGWVLTNPNLIWPGLRLQIPTTVHTVPQPREQRRVAEVDTAPLPPPVETAPAPTTPPADPTPTAAPTSVPTAVPAQPTVAPTPLSVQSPAEEPGESISPLVWGAVALSAAAAAGAATLAARRRVRRSLAEPPIRDPAGAEPQRGFVEADLLRSLVHRLQGEEVEVATLVADQVVRCLKDEGVAGVTVLSVRQGASSATLSLSAGLEQQARIMGLLDVLGARLECSARASLTADRDVELELKGLKLNTVLAPMPVEQVQSFLLPLGMATRHATLYANWHALDHILIAGSPGSGTETVLTSLLTALTARGDPRNLHLWTVAGDRVLLAQVGHLPHQQAGLIDPSDDDTLGKNLASLRTTCDGLLAADSADQTSPVPRPLYVLVTAELTDLLDHVGLLDWIAAHGATHGVRVLAATSQPEAVDDATLAMFGTRVALQTLDEEQSVRLLGRPDAADLNHGEMLLRLDHRPPVWARGFRLSPEHLDEVVRLMGERHVSPEPAPEPTAPGSGKVLSIGR